MNNADSFFGKLGASKFLGGGELALFFTIYKGDDIKW